jgi:hypothetical protein
MRANGVSVSYANSVIWTAGAVSGARLPNVAVTPNDRASRASRGNRAERRNAQTDLSRQPRNHGT